MPYETASKGKGPGPYGSHHNAQLKEQNSATHQMPKRYTKRSETLGEMHPTLKSIRDPFNPTDKPFQTFAVDHCTLRHICPIFPFTHPTTEPTMNPPTIPPMTQNVIQHPSTQSTTPRPVTTHPSTQSATAHQLPQNTEAKKGNNFQLRVLEPWHVLQLPHSLQFSIQKSQWVLTRQHFLTLYLQQHCILHLPTSTPSIINQTPALLLHLFRPLLA